MTDNYSAYLNANFEGRAAGSWVAYIHGKEVAHTEKLRDLLADMKEKYPEETPFVAKLPSDELLVL